MIVISRTVFQAVYSFYRLMDIRAANAIRMRLPLARKPVKHCLKTWSADGNFPALKSSFKIRGLCFASSAAPVHVGISGIANHQ